MQESESDQETTLEHMRKVVNVFGEKEYESLVRRAVYRLQRMTASGIFGDDYLYKSVWDEYCHEVQEGPHDLLGHAWDHILYKAVDSLVDDIPRHVAAVLSMFAAWELDEIALAEGAVWPDGLKTVLRQRLSRQAAIRDIERLRP